MLRKREDAGPALTRADDADHIRRRWYIYPLRCGCTYLADEDVPTTDPIWCSRHRASV